MAKIVLLYWSQNKNRFGATLDGVKLSVQTVKANVEWVKNHLRDVGDWLKNATYQMCHQLIAINILSPVSVTSLGYF